MIKNKQALIDNAIVYREHPRNALNLRAWPLIRQWQKYWLSSKSKKVAKKARTKDTVTG